MKHLIARSGNNFVVGLKDQAFLVLDAKAGSVVELLVPQDSKAEATKEPSKPSDPKKSSTKQTNDEEKSSFPRQKVHDRRKAADEQLKEISAVAIIGDKDTLYCAVARNNKAMHIYALKTDSLPENSCHPSLNYRTPKRVSAFAFADIPTADLSSKIPLLISTDLAGDAYAYNLVEKGERLLLGHTASMLTDIATADNLLFTCDRDEKIRISRWPETYIVEGFLLGHTAFVSGFTTLSSSLGVSYGGDMTVRLWDLKAQVEITSASTSNDENSKADAIPTAIAASTCGSIVAVIYDDCSRLSIYKVNKGETPSLELLENVECPSQPLSIVFNEQGSDASKSELTVLMKDPDYVVVYDIPHSVTEGVAVGPKTDIGVLQGLKDLASTKTIVMPSTVLEKDDFGNPVLSKINETRGPGKEDAPWNRVERVEIAKERERRRKKQKFSKTTSS